MHTYVEVVVNAIPSMLINSHLAWLYNIVDTKE